MSLCEGRGGTRYGERARRSISRALSVNGQCRSPGRPCLITQVQVEAGVDRVKVQVGQLDIIIDMPRAVIQFDGHIGITLDTIIQLYMMVHTRGEAIARPADSRLREA